MIYFVFWTILSLPYISKRLGPGEQASPRRIVQTYKHVFLGSGPSLDVGLQGLRVLPPSWP